MADDHAMLREAICTIIDSWEYCKVVLQAGNGEELLEKLAQQPAVELVICDLKMPAVDGIAATAQIKKQLPETKVLIISNYNTPLAAVRSFTAGADGFIHKSFDCAGLKRVVFSLLKNEKVFPNFLEGSGTQQHQKKIRLQKAVTSASINEAELSFLKYLCSDMTYKEIACKLNITERQADYLREALFIKFNVQSRVGLTIYAIQSGII